MSRRMKDLIVADQVSNETVRPTPPILENIEGNGSVSSGEIIEGNQPLFLRNFPEALPGIPRSSAFGIRKTNLDEDISVNFGAGLWQHNGWLLANISDHAVRGLVEDLDLEKTNNLPISGQISTPHDLTLDAEAKKKANIPENANKFCWGNPLFLEDYHQNLIQKLKSEITTSKEVAFLLYGGFMYFADEELVQCNSLIPSNEGLFFGQHTPFHQIDDHRKIRRQLAEQGRFQEITIGAFRKQGAKYFCWLLPKEFGLCEHGGFLYLFDDNMFEGFHEMDRFFPVLGGDELALRLKEVSTLIEKGMLDQVSYQNQFSHAQMTPQQLADLQITVRKQKEQLEELLDKRAMEEREKSQIMEDWSAALCGRKLCEVGLEENLAHALENKGFQGSDLTSLWRTINSNQTSQGSQVVSNDAAVEAMTAKIRQLQLELEASQQCCICLSDNRGMVLQPCGHIPACQSCTALLQRCPICRGFITSHEPVHL
mmetsp:Transcript_8779/g.11400  ORF Transcript_8779/g.11400 Transcript_8779/m.11400 type:complete len:484 (+) Transcript_8779:104-1555(+)